MSTDTVTVRVRSGWIVAHDGEQRTVGAELAVAADVAEYWQRRGWVEPVQPKRRKST